MPEQLLSFVVMHDYGTEGWQIVGQFETIAEAVLRREEYIAGGGGGTTVVFEYVTVLRAYSEAFLELSKAEDDDDADDDLCPDCAEALTKES